MNVFIKKQNFVWQKIAGLAIVLLLLIIISNTFSQQVRNSFYYLSAPFQRIFWNTGKSANNFLNPLFSANALQQENTNLKQENQQLLLQTVLLQDAIKQNQLTQLAIENTKDDGFTMLFAQVLGLDTNGDFLLINKGSDDGIKENMPVISEQKVLYGKITAVYKNFSKVMLISNQNSVVDAKIFSIPTEVPPDSTDIQPPPLPIYGAVKGNGNLSIYLDLVSSDAQINSSDTLVTSGLEGIFPKDLLIGKITSVDKNDVKPFQTAKLQPFFDVKNTDSLFIITDYMKK